MKNSQFIVGIDLGTTNCVVSYIDTQQEEPQCRLFEIPQVTDIGVVGKQPSLPSFFYIPHESEKPEESYKLPWSADGPAEAVVGAYALMRAPQAPGRVISSAKSWLCHDGVDRQSAILPWNIQDLAVKFSPVAVSSAYLSHIRQAWNHAMAASDKALEAQDVYLTVPASFDAAARDLTVKAAASAGLPDVNLIEEPLSAFYAWVNGNPDGWRKEVAVGDIVVVCDIGGGTTDFSLIAVEDDGGELTLKRIAVGDHILLGGDNMDLMLAYAVKKKFNDDGITIDQHQMMGLIHSSRQAKEKILSDPSCKKADVVVLGRGRSVVGGTIKTVIGRDEVEQAIVDGFFPKCSIEDNPAQRRASGFKELGLQYSADSAVTKFLAKFLRQHLGHEDSTKTFIHPTKILFNGGVTKGQRLRERLSETLSEWLKAEGSESAAVLGGNDPDTAVAIGAAYYGFTKRGKGIRVRGGAGRAYYIGVETSMPAVPGMPVPVKAVCVVPFGMEEGTDASLAGHAFGLVVGEQSVFRFFGSNIRKEDAIGQILDQWEDHELLELAPLEAALEADGDEGTVVPVKIHSYLTEIGTLELWCEALEGQRKWKLQFSVRQES
ncbi:MAG: Hsp70 family protein [Candidatus Magnetominusculus sp. LBB02]|nr:Hsp70 family protein [Candidatus Magnetominusculus sp. LBB02]